MNSVLSKINNFWWNQERGRNYTGASVYHGYNGIVFDYTGDGQDGK